MKIKYLIFTAISHNLGDHAQAYAIYHLFRSMNILEEDIIVVNASNILKKIDVNTVYVVPCGMAAGIYYEGIEYVTMADVYKQFLFLPLSIGLVRNAFGDDSQFKKANWLSDRFVQPIGCRDYDSQSMYEKQGYSTYVYGCITNTLPKRDQKKVYNKIYLCDVPESLYQYMPEKIKAMGIVISQAVDFTLSPERTWELAVERYELLRDTAELVITTRYHIAIPCAAMGIPVIMIDNCDNCKEKSFTWPYDVRLPALNPLIPYYTKDQWQHIDWDPKPAEFEEIKKAMIELAVSRIENAVAILKVSDKISEFLAPSRERFLDICNKNIKDVDVSLLTGYLGDPYLSKIKGSFKFYFYGLSDRYIDRNECVLLEYIKKYYPKAEFLGFVDSKKTGNYFGKKVLSPGQMEIDEDTYCLVSAYTANPYVEQLFEERKYDKTHLWKMPEQILFAVYHL